MITKERLEELIEQGATIFSTHDDYKEIKLNNDFKVEEVWCLGDCLVSKSLVFSLFGISLIFLFETKEDAEFACKYQNISIFYSLNLPTYEDFVKNYQSFGDELITDEKCVIFSCKDGLYSLYACDNEIWVGKDSDGSVMFHKELNKENYIKACDICVKLFKGEES